MGRPILQCEQGPSRSQCLQGLDGQDPLTPKTRHLTAGSGWLCAHRIRCSTCPLKVIFPIRAPCRPAYRGVQHGNLLCCLSQKPFLTAWVPCTGFTCAFRNALIYSWKSISPACTWRARTILIQGLSDFQCKRPWWLWPVALRLGWTVCNNRRSW